MPDDVKTKLEGFDEFKRDTAKINNDLPEKTRLSSVDMAAQWVAAAQSNTHTTQEMLAAAELQTGSSGDGAQITCNSPLFYGAEFGGQGRPETMQFPPFQGQRGYWFYPARRANEDRLAEVWEKGIDIAMSAWDRNG
jgi:hypothetical protein